MEHPAVVALRQFADPTNWTLDTEGLHWMGKRHAIDYAQEVLASLDVICPTCQERPPFGGRCPHPGCLYGLDERPKVLNLRLPGG